jgi:hypothetical protein
MASKVAMTLAEGPALSVRGAERSMRFNEPTGGGKSPHLPREARPQGDCRSGPGLATRTEGYYGRPLPHNKGPFLGYHETTILG